MSHLSDPFARHELRDRLAKLRDDLNEHVAGHPALAAPRGAAALDRVGALEAADANLRAAQTRLEEIEATLSPGAR